MATPNTTTGTTTGDDDNNTLAQLEKIHLRVDVIASEYEALLPTLLSRSAETLEGAEALAKRKNQLILLYTNLEKLQSNDIDGVLVGNLASGKDGARAKRKDLTLAVSDLADKVRTTIDQLKQMLADAPTASNTTTLDDSGDKTAVDDTSTTTVTDNVTAATDTNTPTSDDPTTMAASQQRLAQLDGIQHRVDVFASQYEALERLLVLSSDTAEGAEALAKRENQLILLYANLEKLQSNDIDGVLVGDLTLGQDSAPRAKRKDLTLTVSDLADKIRATIDQLKQMPAGARARAPAASNNNTAVDDTSTTTVTDNVAAAATAVQAALTGPLSANVVVNTAEDDTSTDEHNSASSNAVGTTMAHAIQVRQASPACHVFAIALCVCVILFAAIAGGSGYSMLDGCSWDSPCDCDMLRAAAAPRLRPHLGEEQQPPRPLRIKLIRPITHSACERTRHE